MKPGQVILIFAVFSLHLGGIVFSQMSEQDMGFICVQGTLLDLKKILTCTLGKLTPDDLDAARKFEQCVGHNLADIFRDYCSSSNTSEIQKIKLCNNRFFTSGRNIDVVLVHECIKELYYPQDIRTNKTLPLCIDSDNVQKSKEKHISFKMDISGNITIVK